MNDLKTIYEAIHKKYKDLISALTGKENSSNKITEISSESTDLEYPSAKAVYNSIQQGGGHEEYHLRLLLPNDFTIQEGQMTVLSKQEFMQKLGIESDEILSDFLNGKYQYLDMPSSYGYSVTHCMFNLDRFIRNEYGDDPQGEDAFYVIYSGQIIRDGLAHNATITFNYPYLNDDYTIQLSLDQ